VKAYRRDGCISAKDPWRTVSHRKSGTHFLFIRDVGFLSPSGANKTDRRTSHDRHAACQRTATADMDPFPILRAGAFVTSLAGEVHSRPSIFLSPTQNTTTRVSFAHVRARYVPTLSAQCASLTMRFMPWWAFCVLAYLASVSPPRSAQLWPCAPWVAAATMTCASFPTEGDWGGTVCSLGGEGCSEQFHPARCVSSGLRGRLLRNVCSCVCRNTGEELPDCRQFV